MSPRKSLTAIAIFSTIALSAPSTRANELFSESVDVPPVRSFTGIATSGWGRFTVFLNDDPVLPPQNATDKSTDAFAVNGTSTISTGTLFQPLDSDVAEPVGPGLIPFAPSRVAFTGTTDINPQNIPNQNLNNPPGQVQFGIVGPASNAPLNILAQYWRGSYTANTAAGGFDTNFVIGNGANPLGYHPPIGIPGSYFRGVPVVSIIPSSVAPSTPPPGQSFKYIVDYIQFTQNGITGTEWAEFPYLPAHQPTFTYGGWADPINRIHFTDTEIQLSDTQISIDDLNFASDPLGGGASTPAFTTVANSPDVIPEPGLDGILLFASALLLGRRR